MSLVCLLYILLKSHCIVTRRQKPYSEDDYNLPQMNCSMPQLSGGDLHHNYTFAQVNLHYDFILQ